MKKCIYCGHEIEDDATFCSNCGKEQNSKNSDSVSPIIGILAIVFAILGGWIGLVLGIVGLSNYKDEANKRNCKIAIVIWGVWVVIQIIITVMKMISGAVQPLNCLVF